MTYTQKMHDAIRRDSKGEKTIVTDLLDEIERLKAEAEEHPFHMACSKCRRTHELLQKQVDKLKAEREWQPIETAPKDGMHFLALRSYMEQSIDEAWWHDDIMGDFELGGKSWTYPLDYMPTHWMPLPQPPEEK